MRLTLLDGFRGYFLVVMMLHHLEIVVAPALPMPDHRFIGRADVSQGFVLLSGFVAGFVYTRQMDGATIRAMRDKLRARWRTVYGYHALIVLAVGWSALWASAPMQPFHHPIATVGLSLALLSGAPFIDILPMYLVFMALTPLALRMLDQRRTWTLVSISIAFYTFAQTGLMEGGLNRLGALLGLAADGPTLGLSFNRAAWQVLYFAGLTGGFYYARGRLELSRLKTADHRSAVLAGVLTLSGFALIAALFDLPESAWLRDSAALHQRIYTATDKWTLAPLLVLNVAVIGYALTWLVVAGPEDRSPVVRGAANALRALMESPALRFLGQHALEVYGFHVLVVYFVAFFVRASLDDGPWYLKELVVLSGPLTLFVPAWVHAKWQSRARSMSLEPAKLVGAESVSHSALATRKSRSAQAIRQRARRANQTSRSTPSIAPLS